MVFEKYCIQYLANYWQKYKHKVFHLDTSGFKKNPKQQLSFETEIAVIFSLE